MVIVRDFFVFGIAGFYIFACLCACREIGMPDYCACMRSHGDIMLACML